MSSGSGSEQLLVPYCNAILQNDIPADSAVRSAEVIISSNEVGRWSLLVHR